MEYSKIYLSGLSEELPSTLEDIGDSTPLEVSVL